MNECKEYTIPGLWPWSRGSEGEEKITDLWAVANVIKHIRGQTWLADWISPFFKTYMFYFSGIYKCKYN